MTVSSLVKFIPHDWAHDCVLDSWLSSSGSFGWRISDMIDDTADQNDYTEDKKSSFKYLDT